MKKTTTEAQLREWVASGKTYGEIAKLLGRHASSITATVSVLGISRRAIAPKKHDPLTYLEGVKAGKTLAEIAREHGTGTSTVQMALTRAGLPTCARTYLRQMAEQQQTA